MKILHIISDLERERGGPAHSCTGMADLMAGRGHEVAIITTDRGLAADVSERPGRERDAGNATIEAFPVSWPRFWATSWAMRRRLADAIPKADVIHLHSLYLFHDWVTGIYCRRIGKPYILQPHGTLDPFIHRRHRWRKAVLEALFQNDVQRHAAGLHYTTVEEQALARPYARNPRGWVAPNGIDLATLYPLPPPSTLRARYPQIGDRKVVLFFGRLNFKKGIDTTIRVFATIARERDDVFLVLAGPDGGLRGQAEKWVKEAELGERCLFTGMVTGEDKRVLLAGSDIFMLPSMSENFGIAVVEAAACGIPVIISDRVNLWRDFAEARAGLVGPPTAEAFIRHLRFLLDNPVEAAAMACRGAELVRRRFTWEALGEQYERMYMEAVQGGAGESR